MFPKIGVAQRCQHRGTSCVRFELGVVPPNSSRQNTILCSISRFDKFGADVACDGCVRGIADVKQPSVLKVSAVGARRFRAMCSTKFRLGPTAAPPRTQPSQVGYHSFGEAGHATNPNDNGGLLLHPMPGPHIRFGRGSRPQRGQRTGLADAPHTVGGAVGGKALHAHPPALSHMQGVGGQELCC